MKIGNCNFKFKEFKVKADKKKKLGLSSFKANIEENKKAVLEIEVCFWYFNLGFEVNYDNMS